MLMFLSTIVLAAVQATATPAPAQKAEEKLVCKRFVETGSLVKGRRECKTEREWQRERDNARERGTSVTGCRSGDVQGC